MAGGGNSCKMASDSYTSSSRYFKEGVVVAQHAWLAAFLAAASHLAGSQPARQEQPQGGLGRSKPRSHNHGGWGGCVRGQFGFLKTKQQAKRSSTSLVLLLLYLAWLFFACSNHALLFIFHTSSFEREFLQLRSTTCSCCQKWKLFILNDIYCNSRWKQYIVEAEWQQIKPTLRIQALKFNNNFMFILY